MKGTLTKMPAVLAAITLTCFIILGMALVLIQLFAVLTLNGALAASLGSLKSLAIIISVILGLLSMILSYINKRPGEKSQG